MVQKTPWGHWETFAEGPGYKLKRLHIDCGECFSLQYHEHREEHWVVVEGAGTYTHGWSESALKEPEGVGPGMHIHVPARYLHRLTAAQHSPLVVVEVQTGERCEEADIVRLADKYKRS
ncbi:MAG: phosphomannose isomerase type II C-terminal cupin domain [Rubrivivax sp.]|nr:phosphomannose isomerase type II C-terminal cupin domain [Rubrivivax sp.]